MKKILWFIIGATLVVTHIVCLIGGLFWGALVEHDCKVWDHAFGEES